MLDYISLKEQNIVIYGLGTETERLIAQHGDELIVIGLLDGFRESGEMYGHRIISFDEAIEAGVETIIVVARPGSCKVIAKRIGERCRAEGIKLIDVRGKDLLQKNEVVYDFESIEVGTYAELRAKIDAADVVSFDLFDTLVVRKTFEYTDVFELVDYELKRRGIEIPDFSNRRLQAEKELSKDFAPSLARIYSQLLDGNAQDIADLEWEIDSGLMVRRMGMDEIFSYAVTHKKVYITTDCYYSKEQIIELLDGLGISGYTDILVSSAYGVAKNQGLFEILAEKAADLKLDHVPGILHIGDDEYADVEMAGKYGIDAFKILSCRELFYAMGGLGIEEKIDGLADRVKLGLVLAKLFSDPFCFEKNEKRLCAESAFEMGYELIGAIITDFTQWFKDQVNNEGIEEVLFCARDGYLLRKLFCKIENGTGAKYFLTSRTAAIRAGMETAEDVEYVDSMHFFGDDSKALQVRFGISDGPENESDRTALILSNSERLRENYRKYIEEIGVRGINAAMFDFVAKGTTQLFVQRLFDEPLKGLYFLQLEPEFMKNKGLDIVPFYSDEERDTSAIFDDYYVLETIITSPEPSVDEFDDGGDPVFATETREADTIRFAMDVQAGIEAFFDDYITIVPEELRKINKGLDEALLTLIKKIRVKDEAFYRMVVEDPFFGRMTEIRDVLA